MGLSWLMFSTVCYVLVQLSTGQLLPREELRTDTSCLLDDVDITCGNNEIIAIQSLYFMYDPGCAGTCCNYNSSHSSVSADPRDVQDLLRHCSGQRFCNRHLAGKRDFGSAGLHNPSYVMVQYFCVPDSRVVTICSDEEIISQGLPLYLTNENYPSVTTGDSTCSCSVEVNSCTSNIRLYLFDVDLNLDTHTCEQSLEFISNRVGLLGNISCESYDKNNITLVKLDSHYMNINFIDKSTQDQEGYFFLGLEATEANASFSISCQAKQESICIDCDDQESVSNGHIRLHDVNNTGNGAMADIICNSGYETNKTSVSCLDTGHWENATCIPKDCGKVPVIADGVIALEDSENTTYGAIATVQCSQGFESESDIISCLDSGQWSAVACSLIECASISRLDHGTITVAPDGAIVGSVARVTCDTGYNASVTSITCLHPGEWEVAVCTIKDCGKLPVTADGVFVLQDSENTMYGAIATVKCSQGFESESCFISCLDSGQWSSVACSLKVQTISAGMPEDSAKPVKIQQKMFHDSKNEEKVTVYENNTSIILVSVLVPILVVGISILAFCILWRYQQRLWKRRCSKWHERVSFKNEEVPPEHREYQNLKVSFINEGAQLKA